VEIKTFFVVVRNAAAKLAASFVPDAFYRLVTGKVVAYRKTFKLSANAVTYLP